MKTLARLFYMLIQLLKTLFNWQPSGKLTEADLKRRIVIYPYKKKGQWMFDDDSVGLVEEPLVSGIPEMIEAVIKRKKLKGKNLRLTFRASKFAGHDLRVEWVRSEGGGNWYYSKTLDMEGWLCPALFCYYPGIPDELFMKLSSTDSPA